MSPKPALPASSATAPQAGLGRLLKPYRKIILLLIVLVVIANGLNLVIPLITEHGIDAYQQGTFNLTRVAWQFGIAAFLIFVFAYLQNFVQNIASERVARDVRQDLTDKISRQTFAFVQGQTPSKLLTNLSSDVDAVKMYVSMAIVSISSSLFLIVGASALLLLTNWRLALVVLLILPIIGFSFFRVMKKVRVLFGKAQEVIDWLNKVINESILGAALIRVLHAERQEGEKFGGANAAARDVGMQMLKLFAGLIPIVTFVANLATLAILAIGGKFVIDGSMSIGAFAAFNGYVTILILPIIMIGFMSNVVARSAASYKRITEVIDAEPLPDGGSITAPLRGDIELRNVTLAFGEKTALKDVSFSVQAGSKTAVIGPTGAGKTQLLYLLTGLVKPQQGEILYDGRPLSEYEKVALHRQVGLVFQDSVLFNMTIRENICFGEDVTDEDFQRALSTAELSDFIDALPEGVNTVVSERGSSLSGGQKQRIMLARALALNPKVLLLDDFTARVDTQTEKKILENVSANYPELTLLSITQKIASAEQHDQIVLLMEGEVLAKGTHEQLMSSSTEYVQISESQRSTNTL